MNKKIILTVSGAILLATGFYFIFLKEKKSEFVLVEAVRGDIAQEIFESGQVVRGEKINLSFKNAGRIEEIYVALGDEVEPGQKLAELEATDLYIQLEEAYLSFELALLSLDKLLSGAGAEEIKIVQTQADGARVSLEAAKDNLANAYQSSLTVLDSSYSQVYGALDFASDFIRDYVTVYDREGRRILAIREEMEESEKRTAFYLKAAKENSREAADEALLAMRVSLEGMFGSLEEIRQIIDSSSSYRQSVSATDKALLASLKAGTNLALANVIGVEQSISSIKLQIKAAETRLEEADSRLSLIKAEASQIDIDLYQARVRQAEARVRLYKNQIQQSELVSPAEGKIIEIKKRPGELVQPGFQDVVMVIMSASAYEIKTNIYEEDVVKINIGNPVEISLVAFPGRTFRGNIISINPGERLIDGVVYYETTIGFGQNIEGLRPGLTADLVIEADLKENVLVIPRQAVQRKESRTVVEVFKDGEIQEKRIEVGVRGSDDMVEIISGLEQGEKVILY